MMNWSNRKTAVAAVLFLLLCNGTTALVAYQLTRHRNAHVAIDLRSPGDQDLLFETETDGTPGAVHVMPLKRGMLRIANADGRLDTTNGVDELTVVDANGTNTLSVRRASPRGRIVTRYRVRTSPGKTDDGEGFGEGGVEAGGTGATTTDTPAPDRK